MNRLTSAASALALCLLAGLMSCGGGHHPSGGPASEAALSPRLDEEAVKAFELPSPGSLAQLLPHGRATSYSEADLAHPGSDFDPALPNRNALAVAKHCDFSPSYSGAGGDTAGLAFAVYSFANLLDYDRSGYINFDWNKGPASSTAYVGVANWETSRWDWFALPPSGRVVPASSGATPFGAYVDASGNMLVSLVLTGNSASSLSEVRLGELLPSPRFSADPAGGMAPIDVSFDASSSSAPDSTIIKYEWDLDGDGSFELDKGLVTTAQHSYSTPDTVKVALRVTDDLGRSVTTKQDISTYTEWTHTWGKNLDDVYTAVQLAGSLIVTGGKITSGGNEDVVLNAYTLQGEPAWGRAWDSGGADYLKGIAVSSDGQTIYTCGNTDGAGAGGDDWLIQAWGPLGNLLWTRTLGGSATDWANSLICSADGLYVCGLGNLEGGNSSKALLAKFSLDGDMIWERSWGGGDGEKALSCCFIPRLLGATTIGVLGQTDSFGAGSSDILYLQYSLDGGLISSKTWGDTDLQFAGEISSSLSKGIYATGTDFKAATYGLLLKVDAGASGLALAVTSGDSVTTSALRIDGHSIVLGGKRDNPGGDEDLALIRYDLDTTDLTLDALVKAGGNDYCYDFALLPGACVAVAGSLNDATPGDWQLFGATVQDRSSIQWQSVDQAAVETSVLPTHVIVDAMTSTGTADTGAGNYDCAVGVHQL